MSNPLEDLQVLFIASIETKNSWGKNEVVQLFKDCLLKILLSTKEDK